MRDAHEKSMEDLAADMEAKEKAHAQKIHDIERKFLIDKGNMQKVTWFHAMGASAFVEAGQIRRVPGDLECAYSIQHHDPLIY